jgi:hypothetical protein
MYKQKEKCEFQEVTNLCVTKDAAFAIQKNLADFKDTSGLFTAQLDG